MVELVKGISKLPDRRLEADRPRHSIQFINDIYIYKKLVFDCFSPAVARGSSLIGNCVNEMTLIPEWVPRRVRDRRLPESVLVNGALRLADEYFDAWICEIISREASEIIEFGLQILKSGVIT
ncbi:hypothetical protein TNCV_2284771 [Trichonephila clavipes]|nr:hypothetical protein TNCV_2284771 [Trichonephila clavipes]